MLFLKIYVLFCLLICLIFEIKVNKAITQYRNNIEETENNNPKYLHILFEHIKIWFLCFVPILNFLILISLLVNGINVKDINEEVKQV